MSQPARLAVIGGGWAGLATAVYARQHGVDVSLYEASRQWGGRARTLATPSGTGPLDNGQHILIGAYTQTLALMEFLGVDLDRALRQVPLSMLYPDGSGLAVPDWAVRWPAPLDLLAAMACANGWSWGDKWALLSTSLKWQWQGFRCPDHWNAAQLVGHLPPRVVQDLLEPLCISALNTPLEQASASVLLSVLRNALFGAGHGKWRGADLLLPACDLGALLPEPATRWLASHGAALRLGQRVNTVEASGKGWCVDGELYDQVVLACPPWEAARLAEQVGGTAAAWAEQASSLRHEAIATVYVQIPHGVHRPNWPRKLPILALHSGPTAPAQFVFDRGQLGGPAGCLAFVVSASQKDKALLETQVLEQAHEQLGLTDLTVLQTVVEKRATFACTPGLVRPSHRIAPGLWAVGDYVDGPYPATLEGAVRSAACVVQELVNARPASDRPCANQTPAGAAGGQGKASRGLRG